MNCKHCERPIRHTGRRWVHDIPGDPRKCFPGEPLLARPYGDPITQALWDVIQEHPEEVRLIDEEGRLGLKSWVTNEVLRRYPKASERAVREAVEERFSADAPRPGPPPPEAFVACSCGTRATLKNARFRPHETPSGEECPRSGTPPTLAEDPLQELIVGKEET